MKPTVDVIIPTYRPASVFRRTLVMLSKQKHPVDHILILNTGEEDWDPEWIRDIPKAEVFHIRKDEFDHAATRNMGAGFSNARYLIFMTQDAEPADTDLVGNLLRAFRDPMVKAAYARQLPRRDCLIPEGCVRSYNYPEESSVRTIEDLPVYGIRTFFCSNVCAAYDARVFREAGGFSAPCIFSEDMIYAARIMSIGYAVAYCADARVIHSHNYSAVQQFHRNFDNGVSQAMHPEIFRNIRSVGEGKKMVREVSRALRGMGRFYLIPSFWWQCFMRGLGFWLGKHYRSLPRGMVMSFTMNRGFWKRIASQDSTEEEN